MRFGNQYLNASFKDMSSSHINGVLGCMGPTEDSIWIVNHKRAVSSNDRCRWLSLDPGKIASKFAVIVFRGLEPSK